MKPYINMSGIYVKNGSTGGPAAGEEPRCNGILDACAAFVCHVSGHASSGYRVNLSVFSKTGLHKPICDVLFVDSPTKIPPIGTPFFTCRKDGNVEFIEERLVDGTTALDGPSQSAENEDHAEFEVIDDKSDMPTGNPV